VIGLLIATVLLSVVAFLSDAYLVEKPNPPLDVGVRIVILILGLGAVVWRRTKFQAMRLQDIAGLAGVTGLIKTLEKTTVQIAVLGAAIAVIGFVATLMTGNERYSYWAGAIAVVVFIYSYPTKSSWLRALYRFTEKPNHDYTDRLRIGFDNPHNPRLKTC
jgi:hypothetical protein